MKLLSKLSKLAVKIKLTLPLPCDFFISDQKPLVVKLCYRVEHLKKKLKLKNKSVEKK